MPLITVEPGTLRYAGERIPYLSAEKNEPAPEQFSRSGANIAGHLPAYPRRFAARDARRLAAA